MYRLLLLMVSFGLAGALAAQEKPAITFQAKSPAALLSHIREGARIIDGKAGVEKFEKELKDQLGEDGLTGLNLTQPILGYARLEGKPEETSFVFVVPISNEKDFLALLDRADFTVEELETEKGIYRIDDDASKPVHMRMTASHAYISIGISTKSLEPKALIPIKDLLDPTETGLFALQVHPERASKEYRDLAKKGLDAAARDENLGDQETKWLKGLIPMAEMLLSSTERLTIRGDFDPTTAMAAVDINLVPKKNSLLSLAFAARKPNTNRYAGAAALPDVAQILLLTFPGWSKEISEGMSASLSQASDFTKRIFAQGRPADLQPSIGKFLDGMASAAKSGSLDVVSLTTEPGKDGSVVNALAFRVDKPEDVEKELLALASKIAEDDAELAKKIVLTAAKHGGFAIHTMELGEALEKPMRDMLGADAKLAIACGKDTVYVALGSKAVDGVKLLIDAKVGEAPALDLQIRPQGFAKAYRSMGMMESVEQTFGTATTPKRVLALNATSSAAALNIRAEMHLGLIPLGAMMQRR